MLKALLLTLLIYLLCCKEEDKKGYSMSPRIKQSHFDPEFSDLRKSAAVTLGGAVLVRQAFLPGANRKCEQGEENAPYHQDGPPRSHAGHRPGQFMV